MNTLTCTSLGQAWLNLLAVTVNSGKLGSEGYEVLGASVVFPARVERDFVLERFGDPQMMAEMKKVFFEATSNSLGHSYAGLMRGPGGRKDLEDVVSLLGQEPRTKRAVVTLCGVGDGKVPCLNAIQFLVRDCAVQTIYFARGQDAFKKFYADGLCVAAMADKVAGSLEVPAGLVRGYVGSSHVYREDLPAVRQMLEQGRRYLLADGETGANR